MIWLIDDELSALMNAAKPLPPKLRGEFLRAVASEIEHQSQRGPGAIFRVCRDLQPKFFDPPSFRGGVGKYD